MIQKLFITWMMSGTLLFANSIVGAWTIDKNKAQQAIKVYAEDEMEEFFISMLLMSMADIEFQTDGRCKMTQKSHSKCWTSHANHYTLYGDKGKKSGEITLVDDKHLLLKLSDEKIPKVMSVEYSRVALSTKVAPKIVMEKDKVYHAKHIKHEMLENGGDGFLIFTGEDDYYNLLTDAFSTCSKEKLKAIIKKDKSNQGGFLLHKGAYVSDSGQYKIKDNAFYTFFEGRKIEVLTPNHIYYDGNDYYLQND